jgi:hypothetical protein
LGSLPSDELDLLLAVSSLVIFCTFVDVLLTTLQHSIDQPSEPMKFPWIHDGKPEEVVFKVVTTIPMSDFNPVSSTKDFRSMSRN